VKPALRPLVLTTRFGTMDELLGRAQAAERMGVDQLWVEQPPDQRDAFVSASYFLNAAPTVTLGTAVLPIYARHPVSMAQAAATLGELSQERFLLGLGLSHRFVNEHVLGLQQGPPITVTREYLSIVKTLLTEGSVEFEGRFFTARAQYQNPRPRVPIYLAALRPQMIRLAVALCDGILLFLCSARYIREQIMPVVRAACDEFGRDESDFTVLAITPAYVDAHFSTKHIEEWKKVVMAYRLLPYYRYVLDAYGSIDHTQLTLMGTKDQAIERLEAFRATGCVVVPSPRADTDEEFYRTLEGLYGT
jgi:5,10-methylenetetrahydromethanopterin reductase